MKTTTYSVGFPWWSGYVQWLNMFSYHGISAFTYYSHSAGLLGFDLLLCTDASRKLNNPCRLYLCVMCVCMCLSLCMRVCVWCSVQYVRLLTRSWRLSVKLDSWLQAGVNTWHHACLQLRWIIAHVRGLKCQNEGMENNICEVNGGGNRSMWKMLYWLLDLFAWVKKFLIWFNSLKRWFDRWAPTAPSDEPVPLHQHCHLFEPFMIIFS